MKKNSTLLAVAIMVSFSIVIATAVFFVGKNSPAYRENEEYGLVSVIFAISAIIDFMIYFLRWQNRDKKYFRLTKKVGKEPDSPELEKFKSDQKMILYMFLIHLCLFLVFSLIEFILM